MKLYEPNNARSFPQHQSMIELERQGKCIFCDKSDAVEMGKLWHVRKNDFPYDDLSDHWLIVYNKHVKTSITIDDQGLLELAYWKNLICSPYDSCKVIERSGNMKLNGGSVQHFHVHVIGYDLAG